MPCSEPDEKELLRLLEQPKTPATAGRTTTALKQYADLVQMSARCGVEVARYSYLKNPVRTLVKLAESEERDEKGLAEALVIFSDTDRRLEAAAAARKMAETRFDSRRQGDELVDLLRSIEVSGPRGKK